MENLRTLASEPNGELEEVAANGHVDTLKVLDLSGDPNAEMMSTADAPEGRDCAHSVSSPLRDAAPVVDHVAASDSSHLAVSVWREQIAKPVGAGHGVVVDEGDDVGSCMMRPPLHGGNHPRLLDKAFIDGLVQRGQDLRSPLVPGSTNNHDLIWRRIKTKQSLQAGSKFRGTPPCRDDHTHSGGWGLCDLLSMAPS
jgi:hypothetical protein